MYLRFVRWATNRIGKSGIIAFVSNGAWIDGNSTDGFRKSLEEEFSSIWVFNLRGNARTQGELRKKEAGNVFGSGSRTPIAITILVKNSKSKNKKATIHYYDIGDYCADCTMAIDEEIGEEDSDELFYWKISKIWNYFYKKRGKFSVVS